MTVRENRPASPDVGRDVLKPLPQAVPAETAS
jgi:hypothetical protein